ncbi:MAG: WS/DGAT domain-containing protein [Ilumatobacter sp.]
MTAMSYDGAFDISIFCDPAAITDPGGFRDDIIASFADLVALT